MQTTNLSSVWGTRTGSNPTSSPDRSRRSPHTQEQALFLHRFEALLTKRQQHRGRLPSSDWRMRLIDKALYSTYRDCLNLSVGDEAKDLLRRERTTSPS